MCFKEEDNSLHDGRFPQLAYLVSFVFHFVWCHLEDRPGTIEPRKKRMTGKRKKRKEEEEMTDGNEKVEGGRGAGVGGGGARGERGE